MTRLSYVVTTDAWEPVAELAEALAGQTASGELELVLVCDRPLEPPDLRIPVLVVVASGRAARAAGVRAATGDVVALGETHVTPSPGWARAALDAHDAGAVAVLPRMQNANPGRALSWAAFLMDYGRYARPAPPTTPVPTYNATVLRKALVGLPELERTLVPGLALDEELRARSAAVLQAPAAGLAHLNVDMPLDWARERLLGGILLARGRRVAFGPWRRIGYALAWPLIALVLFRRAVRARYDDVPRGTTPALALACAISALGEAVGYVGPSGSGRAERRMLAYETHKRAHASRTA